MENLIDTRWLLLDYFNSVNLEDTNGQVARFILENPKLFENKSLTYIGETSCFSEPTLSRFFKNVCSTTYSNFKKNDIISKKIIKNHFFKLYNMKEIYPEFHSQLYSDVLLTQDIIKFVTNKIIESKRILILGPSSLLSYSYDLQSLFLYYDKLIYMPSNYHSQIKLISKMDKNDLVITNSIFSDWLNSSIVKESISSLNSSKATILTLTSTENSDFLNYPNNSVVIQLTKQETMLSKIILCIFYQLLTRNCFLELSKNTDDE